MCRQADKSLKFGEVNINEDRFNPVPRSSANVPVAVEVSKC